MPRLGINELLIILLVVLVLFGGRKLPELAKGLGQGLKEFKGAIKENTSAEEEKRTEA